MQEVYRVITVEDSDREYAVLEHGLQNYGQEKGVGFHLSRFTSVEEFLTAYKGSCDLVFMDIQLPGTDGMIGARRLREMDSAVALVFMTNLAQYAVNGYEVDAMDYIVKPLSVRKLHYVMDKTLQRIALARTDRRVIIRNVSSVSSVNASAILFAEVNGHQMTVHLSDGREIRATGSLSALYDELKDCGFERCNSCYLVNMRYVTQLKDDMVCMTSGEELLMSKRKKREFTERFMDYLTHL